MSCKSPCHLQGLLHHTGVQVDKCQDQPSEGRTEAAASDGFQGVRTFRRLVGMLLGSIWYGGVGATLGRDDTTSKCIGSAPRGTTVHGGSEQGLSQHSRFEGRGLLVGIALFSGRIPKVSNRGGVGWLSLEGKISRLSRGREEVLAVCWENLETDETYQFIMKLGYWLGFILNWKVIECQMFSASQEREMCM